MAGAEESLPEDLVKISGYCVPEALREHFEYIGSFQNGNKTLLRCKHCNEKKRGKNKDTGNFKRHLTVSVF